MSWNSASPKPRTRWGSGNAASAQKLVELADMKLSWDIDEGFRQCPAFAGTDDGDNKALTKSETFGSTALPRRT